MVDFASTLDVDPRIREAIGLSLESGLLRAAVHRALMDARLRERDAHERPTAPRTAIPARVVEVRETHTLPTTPLSYEDPPTVRRRSLTHRGGYGIE